MAKSILPTKLQDHAGCAAARSVLMVIVLLGALALGSCKTGKPTYSHLKQAFR